MFFSYLLQDLANFDKIWYIVFWINLPQSVVNIAPGTATTRPRYDL